MVVAMKVNPPEVPPLDCPPPVTPVTGVAKNVQGSVASGVHGPEAVTVTRNASPTDTCAGLAVMVIAVGVHCAAATEGLRATLIPTISRAANARETTAARSFWWGLLRRVCVM